jgi:hypothetical protein
MNYNQNFLDDINQQLFPRDITDKNLRERIFFLLRFQCRESQPSHVEIAKQMSQTEPLQGVNCQTSINTTVQNVIRRLVEVFGEEMAKDGVNTAPLIQRQRGKKGAWEVVYQWLWEDKFPRWQLDWIWQGLVKQADSPADWIRFTPVNPGDRKLVVPLGKTREQPVIGLNIPSMMHIDLECDAGHLLLLNRGSESQYIMCPSAAFAPRNRLTGETILMPQLGAMCEQDKIKFDTPGKEEFLGIVVNRWLEFPWLKPNEEEPAPIWDTERLHQLWVNLEGEENWRGFYQAFEVVEV